MNFDFHPEAEVEFFKAIEYYEARSPGLGLDFSRKVYQAIQLAVEHPQAWPELEGRVHRVLTMRFPYAVLYSTSEEGILILAVMNTHRKPDYWSERS